MAKLGASAGWSENYVETVTESKTLNYGDSGKVFLVGTDALVITLPAVAIGLEFTIVQAAAYDSAPCTVDSAEGNNWVGNIDAQTGAGDNSAGTDDKVSFGSATVAGDYIKITCDGTNWIITGSCSKVTTNGIVFA